MEDTQKKETKPELGLGEVLAAAWRSLKSTQTTLYLLVGLALASVIGILVPQGAPPEAYTEKFGEAVGSLVVWAGLGRVFSSWWYLLLLALLTMSAGACARRIMRLGHEVAAGPSLALLRRKLASGQAASQTATLDGSPERVVDQLTQSLRRRWYRIVAGQDEAGTRWLVVRKHGWAAYGIIFSHLAIFAIVLGAIMGVWPGLALDKTINVTEGDTYTDPQGSFAFALRLNSFAVEYYPDQTTVKSYKSDVSVLEDDREVKRQMVLVNHPLSYRHINFYQSSWGIGGFTLKVTPPQGDTEELRFPLDMVAGGDGAMYDIPSDGAVQFLGGRHAAIVVKAFSPDGPEGESPMSGASTDKPSQAAAEITMVSGFAKGGDHSITEIGWVKQGQPVKAGDYLVEMEPVRFYSGLNARRDYGVPLVWLGFAVLVLGLMATFYFRPHGLVVEVAPAGSGSQVTLASFDKGGAGEERWQTRPDPVVGQILGQLQQKSASSWRSDLEESGEE